jgi:hypothetical protein
MRLLGAFFPKTEAGTMVGRLAAIAVADVFLIKVRRLSLFLFMS